MHHLPQHRWFWPLLIMAITVTAYWAGLSGPFLFDDIANLAPLEAWSAGQRSALETAFGNTSGMLGRPVAMLTFMASTWVGGYNEFSFKIGNLVTHLVCGLLLLKLTKDLFRRITSDTHAATSAALLAFALWMLWPIQTSTVLYSVQRMAQLSTLFVFLGLITYLSARTALELGRVQRGAVLLFVAFPALLVVGLLSKENAIVLPALAALIEMFFFRAKTRGPLVKAFFGLFLVIPAVTFAAILVISPEVFLGGYANREFTLAERLLSQPRALTSYLHLIVFPQGSAMGIFNDDFPISTSLLSPPATLAAIVSLLVISACCLHPTVRRSGVAFGWFFFLIAHSLESSIFPLELYFEHRNYLPSAGIAFALCAGFIQITSRAPAVSARALLICVSLVFVYAISTAARAHMWGNSYALLISSAEQRPNSYRALYTASELYVDLGMTNEALDIAEKMRRHNDERIQSISYAHKIAIECRAVGAADRNDLAKIRPTARNLSINEVTGFTLLANIVRERRCDGMSPTHLADTIESYLSGSDGLSIKQLPVRNLRYQQALLYHSEGRWSDVVVTLEPAWRDRPTYHAGMLLADALLQSGDIRGAEDIVSSLEGNLIWHQTSENKALNELKLNIISQINSSRPRTEPL